MTTHNIVVVIREKKTKASMIRNSLLL